MLSVNNLRKSYNGLIAVDGISFEVKKGETFGLLGPNGAGKSTTINMMTGLLRPDAGTVGINGDGNPLDSRVRLQIGNAPQSLSIYEDLNAEENLAFFGKLYGLSGKVLSERIEWTLELSGLQDRKKDLVKTFSGGMKRRLNLVCALIHRPRILMLDEPTVGVDPQSRNYIFDNIEKLKSEGLTIVYTTHYMEEAQRLCDRVAIIDKGEILALNSVDRLIEEHGGESVIKATLESPPADGMKLPGELNGVDLRIETMQPMKELAKLTASGLKFVQLQVDRPDLEAVFLNLTGRRLRDR